MKPTLGQKKYSFVSGAPGDENKSHAGGRKNIFFWKYVEINIVDNSEFYFFFGHNRLDKHVSNNQRPYVITF